MTTATTAITWQAYGQITMSRLRAAPTDADKVQAWLALAVEEADRYLDQDFTESSADAEWIDGVGWDDGWTPLVGPTLDDTVYPDIALPRAVYEGCLAFVRAMRAGEIQDVGIASSGTGYASETRTAQTANSVYLRALAAARPFWDSLKRLPMLKGSAL